VATSITTLAPKAREYGRDLSLAHKVIAVIMGVTSAALLLACLALVAYDTSTARTSLTRDIGMLADVVGTNSTAAVSFSDANGCHRNAPRRCRQQERAHGGNLSDGPLFARFESTARHRGTSMATRVSPELLRAPRSTFTLTGNRFGSCARFS
jgi:hypothetical protein